MRVRVCKVILAIITRVGMSDESKDVCVHYYFALTSAKKHYRSNKSNYLVMLSSEKMSYINITNLVRFPIYYIAS